MKDSRTKPYLLSIFAYFSIGCMVLTANTVMKPIMEQTGWSNSQSALLITCMSMGNLLMSIVGNLLMEKTGRRGAMLLYSMVMCLSFALFALLPLPMTYYVLLFLAGCSWGGINSLVNTVVTEMYDGSASRLNIMHASYAVGAVTFPLLMGFLTKSGAGWQVPVGIVAVLGAGLFVFSLTTGIPARQRPTAEDGSQRDIQFWKELGFYLSAMTFFLYVGVETSASSWLSSHLSQTNAFFREHVPSETMVSLMWLTMLIGRLIFAAIGTRVNRRVLLVALSAGFLIGMTGIVLFSESTVMAILSVALMGLSMSAMYATAVSNAARYVAGSAVAPGIMFGMGGLGSAVVPFIAGIVADAAGLTAGMWSLCGFLLLLLGISALNLTGGRR